MTEFVVREIPIRYNRKIKAIKWIRTEMNWSQIMCTLQPGRFSFLHFPEQFGLTLKLVLLETLDSRVTVQPVQ